MSPENAEARSADPGSASLGTAPEVWSMTGYAQVAGSTPGGWSWTLSLKSVNHRFLDLHLRMPPGTEPLELRLRDLIRKRLRRGHLELTLSLNRTAGAAPVLNLQALRGYIDAFRLAASENHLDQQPDLNALLRLPGVLDGEGATGEREMQALAGEVMARADSLIAALNAMRLREGRALAAVLIDCMARLDAAVEEISGMRQDVEKAYFDRLSQRLHELVGGSFERDRVLAEAALLAERSDIEEETVRLRAHIRHFLGILQGGGEVGKKLDFLLQEMNREANTLLSKTGGVAASGQRVTELGLAMKSEIEKAREQVQNLE